MYNYFEYRLVRVLEGGTGTALEVVAGSKLGNVVVDTEETAKLLINKGKLKSRVTIIPLSKIDSRYFGLYVMNVGMEQNSDT